MDRDDKPVEDPQPIDYHAPKVIEQVDIEAQLTIFPS